MSRISLIALALLVGVAFSGPAFSKKGARPDRPTERSPAQAVIETSPHARQYLPSTYVILNGGTGEMCDADGRPNPSVKNGKCFDVGSQDQKSFWRFRAVRTISGMGALERIWKREDNNLTLWAYWEHTNGADKVGLSYASPEAQQFAGIAGGGTPNVATTPPSPGNTAEKAVDDIVKKGILGILGGLKGK